MTRPKKPKSADAEDLWAICEASGVGDGKALRKQGARLDLDSQILLARRASLHLVRTRLHQIQAVVETLLSQAAVELEARLGKPVEFETREVAPKKTAKKKARK